MTYLYHFHCTMNTVVPFFIDIDTHKQGINIRTSGNRIVVFCMLIVNQLMDIQCSICSG